MKINEDELFKLLIIISIYAYKRHTIICLNNHFIKLCFEE